MITDRGTRQYSTSLRVRQKVMRHNTGSEQQSNTKNTFTKKLDNISNNTYTKVLHITKNSTFYLEICQGR